MQPPPSDGRFNTWEIAYEHCQQWAKAHGYCLVIKSSAKSRDKINIKTKVLVCDQWSTYTIAGKERKHRQSKKTDCPFKCRINRADGTYYIKIDEPAHNHQASWSYLKHAIHRRRDTATQAIIHAQIRANTRPQEIITGLRQNGGTNILIKDLYNEKRLWRKWQLNGNTPTEALLLQLQQSSEWTFSYLLDEQHKLKHLFFAHNSVISIMQSHPDILMADCTYKSNRFNMPLLHFLGVSAVNKHFSGAYAIISDETAPSYLWACQQLDQYIYAPVNREPDIFGSDNEAALKNAAREVWKETPHYLCYWHIQKNVVTALNAYNKDKNGPFMPSDDDTEFRDSFMKAFNNMNKAPTEDTYEQHWSKLQRNYAHVPRLVGYLRDKQYPQRKEVARAWTSRLNHYGNTTTSKLEGIHRVLKGYLGTSQGDILYMVNGIESMVNNWLAEYKGYLARTYTRPLPAADASKIECCDDNLNKYITNHAMELFAKQLALAQSPDMNPECSALFQMTYGIPCCHTIKTYIDTEQKFEADDFDPHWLWERDDCENVLDIATVVAGRKANEPLVFAPATVIRKRGRPRTTKSGRILSQFEATAPGKKRRTEPTPIPPSARRLTLHWSPSDEEEDEYSDGFMDINDPSLAELIDLTSTAPPAQTPASTAPPTANTAPKSRAKAAPKAPTPAPQPKKRGRISKAKKEEAMQAVVTAMSEAGCSANLKQLTALETDWYTNYWKESLANLLMAMTRAGASATKKQHSIIKEALASDN